MLSKKLLEELKNIFKEDYGIELQPQVITEIGNTLVAFFETLVKIDAENL